MGIASMLCTIIYESFLLLAAAIEISILAAEMTLKAIDIFFNAIVMMITETMDVVLSGYVEMLEKIITAIADIILSKIPNKKFCTNLFKCLFMLEQIMDSASTVHSTLKKWGAISEDSKFGFSEETNEKIQFWKSLMSDYDAFAETVCNFGFTFAMSLDSFKAIIATMMGKVNSFLNFLTKKKNAIIKMCQGYIDELKNSGILDLIKKLTSFFKCVISLTDSTCTSLDTSQSFYKTCLKKLNIEETGDGYKFNQETTDAFNSFIDGRVKSIKRISKQAQDVFDMVDEELGLKGASNGFNLFNLLSGIQDGWRHSGFGKYFIAKSREFKRLFIDFKDDSKDSEDMNLDYVLNGMKINEITGEITINYKGEITVINEDNCEEYGFSMEEAPYDEQFEPPEAADLDLDTWFIDPETDMLMSARRAGHKAAKDKDGSIALHLRKFNDLLTNGIPEYEIINAWEK